MVTLEAEKEEEDEEEDFCQEADTLLVASWKHKSTMGSLPKTRMQTQVCELVSVKT